MNYAILASGSKGNACIIETNGTRILIDCGTTKRYLSQSFESLGLRFDDIDHVLITHDHSDHTSQLKHFKNKSIFTSSPDMEDFTTVTPYEPFEIDGIHIMPIKTSHDDAYSVGYVLDDGKRKLVYMTDTGYVKETDLVYLRNADYYILESNHDPEMLMKTIRPYYIKQRILSDVGHLSNADAGLVLSKVVTENTKQIVLAHLSAEANTEALAIETVSEIVSNPRIEISVAKQYEIVMGGINNEKQ